MTTKVKRLLKAACLKLLLLPCAMQLTVLISSETLAAAEPAKPNIIVILADDLGWGHVGWQNPKVKTPNLDRLVGQGVRLDRHYVAPVCSPSRVGLLTGRYWSRFDCNSFTDTPQVLPVGTETVASALKSVGYRTALVGKWHVGTSLDFGPEAFGFDYFYGIRNGGIHPITHNCYYKGVGDSILYRNKEIIQETGHVTDLFAREAIQWIGAEPGRPFFLYLPFTAPHVPLVESARWTDLYKGEGDYKMRYWAAISHLDEAVGKVVAEVERLGQRENTLIIFLSDNGSPEMHSMPVEERLQAEIWDVNPPFRGVKGNVYEGGIHTPGLAIWPGHLKPGVCATPLHITDWMPTLCGLAGYHSSRDLKWDGKNILPILQPESGSEAVRFLYTHGQYAKDRALIEKNWKLVITTKGASELYDLATDIGEKMNLATEHPEIVHRLQAAMKEASVRDNDAKPPAQK